jgi:hypothetical protein
LGAVGAVVIFFGIVTLLFLSLIGGGFVILVGAITYYLGWRQEQEEGHYKYSVSKTMMSSKGRCPYCGASYTADVWGNRPEKCPTCGSSLA